MNKFEAQTLWDAIEAYASNSYELGQEDHSGEFGDDEKRWAIVVELHERRKVLLHTFFDLTGFSPVLAWSGSQSPSGMTSLRSPSKTSRTEWFGGIFFAVLVTLNWLASIVAFIMMDIPLWRAIWPPNFPGWDSIDDVSRDACLSWMFLITTFLMSVIIPAVIIDIRSWRKRNAKTG
jgi:hypothetical protein